MSTAPEDFKMEYRFLGKSGLRVSAISLGGWLTYGGHVDENVAYDCMKAAFDLGINFFDNAEAYAGGESERVMGNAIKKLGWKRCDYVISTKINFGAWMSSPTNKSAKAQNTVGLSRKHIVEGMNGALERLQLDYVDLVYAHRPDRHTPMEEVVRAFNHLIDQGKAFYWGTSMWTAQELESAWEVAKRLNLIGPVMEQPEYSLVAREKVEVEYLPLYSTHGLGLTVWSPLAQGLLTGKYNGGIPDDSRFSEKNMASNSLIKLMKEKTILDSKLAIARGLEPIAKELGITQAALALAWVLKNENVSTAIIGASRPEQVAENCKAIEALPKLTDEIMGKIEKLAGNKPALEPRRFGMP